MRTIDRLSFAPIAVPALGRYGFRTHYRGSLVEIEVGRARAAYRLVAGDAVAFTHHGEPLRLEPGQRIERELPA
jgi:alpha,alpha-trehalose phosphorylase